MSGEPTLDAAALDRLLEITGDDVAFVDELIDTYLEDALVQLAAMDDAAATGDAAALVRPAHSLKSNSENVGAVPRGNHGGLLIRGIYQRPQQNVLGPRPSLLIQLHLPQVLSRLIQVVSSDSQQTSLKCRIPVRLLYLERDVRRRLRLLQ